LIGHVVDHLTKLFIFWSRTCLVCGKFESRFPIQVLACKRFIS